jgi:midasin
MGMGDGGGGE